MTTPSSVAGIRPFPIEDLRRRFPALERTGSFLFFDNAAGAQIPANVLEAVTEHLLARNVQRGGPYRHSREVDAMIARARQSVAAFVNARSAGEIAFGLNATSFIRAISLAVGQTLAAHDLCSSLRPYRKRHHMQAGVGHYGVFSGKAWQQQIYPMVKNVILQSD